MDFSSERPRSRNVFVGYWRKFLDGVDCLRSLPLVEMEIRADVVFPDLFLDGWGMRLFVFSFLRLLYSLTVFGEDAITNTTPHPLKKRPPKKDETYVLLSI